MKKIILFPIFLLFPIIFYAQFNGAIIATRNVCVGDTANFKIADFPCVPSNNSISVLFYGTNKCLVKSLTSTSISVQGNFVATVYVSVSCSAGLKGIQVNFIDCDTAQCLGPNLVPNPSVETIASCVADRTWLTGIAANWLDYPRYNGLSYGSCDVYNTQCAFAGSSPFRTIDVNNKPRTGNGMLGCYVSYPVFNSKSYLEFPTIQLTQPLVVGQQYRVRFFVKLPKLSPFGTVLADRIGASFIVGNPTSAFLIDASGYADYVGEPAKVFNPVGNIIRESDFWTKIEGVFTATKPYTHLVVGNLGGLTTSPANTASYYLFDDFLVQTTQGSVARTITQADTIVCKGQTANLRIKTFARRTFLKDISTNQTSVVDTSQAIRFPNVTATACYRLLFENDFCKDSFDFCVRNYPISDTTIFKRFSCQPRDTGVVVRVLRSFRGCDSIVRERTELKLKDTTRTTLFVCNKADTTPILLRLTSFDGCDSLVLATRKWVKSDTVLLSSKSCFLLDTGRFVRKLVNRFGCDSVIISTVSLRQIDTTSGVQFVCNQLDTGRILLKLKAIDGCDSFVLTTRKFVKSDTTRFENLSCFPKDTGLVVKRFSNRFGCDSITLTRTKLTVPTLINLGSDTVVDIGSKLQLLPILTGDSAKTILWQPPLGLSCTNCLNPDVILPQSVLYTLTVTNKGGCVSKAERLFRAIDKPYVFVPTAFSPNGDNINETLTVYANTNRVEMIKKLSIFDRWGNLIFIKKDFLPNDESVGWDGLFNGSKVGQDVYIYVVEFMLFDKQIKTVSGDVTVMR